MGENKHPLNGGLQLVKKVRPINFAFQLNKKYSFDHATIANILPVRIHII